MAEKRALFAGGADTIRDMFRFSVSTDYNLLFRLNSPSTESIDWKIEYFLQSIKDPSLMHPLEKAPSFLAPVAVQRLAAAAKISSFAKPGKFSVSLDAREAFCFLKQDAFSLREAGHAVQIPRDLENQAKPPLRINLSLRDNSKLIAGTAGKLDVLDFDYQIAIGDAVLSLEEFEAIAAVKAPLVQVKGKWVEVSEDDVSRLMQSISSQGETKSLKNAMAFALSAAEDGIETEINRGKKKFDSIIEAICDEEKMQIFQASSDFKGMLRPYQQRGVGWLDFLSRLGIGALLADDMGLGKTIQIIAHVLKLKEKGDHPVLIICPTSVLGNWEHEFARFAPSIKVKIHHGSGRSNADSFKNEAKKYDVILTSYALAWRDEEHISSINWELVVLDEAQNVKNPFTKQSKKVKAIPAKSRIALTGTPIENRLSDIWSIMEFLNPGYLPQWERFKERFAKPIETDNNMQKKSALKSALNPFILRRLKTDKSIIRELPEKIESLEWCGLTTEQATLYKAVVDSSLEKIQSETGEQRRMAIFATITKLKQICNHPANFLKDSTDLGERSGKVERLRELVREMVDAGESCLVFSQYTEMASMIQSDLEKDFKVPIYYLHGQLQRKARDRVVFEFQNNNGPAVLVLSLKAGGIGLNLTKASNVIHFDRWWNPAVENQATDRAFRIGQKKNVFVYKFVSKGTIEERIENLLSKKKDLADSIVGSGESILSRLDGNKLKEMLELKE